MAGRVVQASKKRARMADTLSRNLDDMAERMGFLPRVSSPEPYQLRRFSQQAQRLMLLTARVAPFLPEGGAWQVAALGQGDLCLSTPHHALAAQVRYCQHALMPKLRELEGLESVQRLRVIVTPLPAPKRLPPTRTPDQRERSRTFLAQARALLNDT